MAKDAPNIQISITSFLYKISTQFLCMVRISGPPNSNMLSKISRDLKELPWKPNLDKKISQNCTNFNYVQEIKEYSHV